MYIINAAILYDTGELLQARRHYQVIAMQAKLGIKTTTENSIQGFVLENGEFVTREEAKAIALESGQIDKSHEGILYSEDLWPDAVLLER